MITNENVKGTQDRMPLSVEQNGGTVYVRHNIVRKSEKVDGEKMEFWQYDEVIMTVAEYDSVKVGRLIGMEWTDVLRGIERSGLYDYADMMIQKYSTDAADETMKQKWIQFKAGVRATQKQKTYPQTVSYPEMPEE